MATRYLVILHPIEGQNTSSYDRDHRTAVLPLGLWTCQGAARDRNGNAITPPSRVRLRVDEVPGEWLELVPGVPTWSAVVDLRTLPATVDGLLVGTHAARWEAEGDPSWFGNCFLFQAGPALGENVEQWCWTGPTKFDDHYGSITSCVPYRWRYVPGFTPRARAPYPAEVAQPWGVAALPHAQQEAQNLTGTVSHHALQYEPCVMAPDAAGGLPRVSVSAKQTYSYFHQDKLFIRLRDGERGLSSGGHPWKCVPSNTPGAAYWLSIQKRLWWVGPNGRMVTVAGWRQKPGQLAPYPADLWPGSGGDPQDKKDYYMSRMEFWGTLDPDCRPWDRPWGFDALDRYTEPGGFHQFAICNTFAHQVQHVDHMPAHHGEPPKIHLLADLPPDALPWDCVFLPSGELWVTDTGRHSLWRLEVEQTAPGRYRTVSVTEFRSEILPTLADIGLTQIWFEPSKQSVQSIRDRYYREGVLADPTTWSGGGGRASIPWPQGIDRTSDGKLVVGCRYGFTLHEIDPDTLACRKITDIWEGTAQGTGDYGYKDVNVSVNWDGTTGPLDAIRAVGWGMNCDRLYLRTGGSPTGTLGRIFPDGGYRQAMEGAQTTVTTWEYPGAAASRHGYVFLSGLGTFQAIWRIRKRVAADPTLNQSLFQSGSWAWKRGDDRPNVAPSFALTHGEHGAGRFGLSPTLDELGMLADADLAAVIRAGAGTGIPRQLSAANMAALTYYIRATAKPTAAPPTVSYPALGAPSTVRVR